MSIRPRPSASVSEENGSRDLARTIVMSPHKLLAGIAFHLIDNRHATAVDDRARLKTLTRLRRHGFKACVARPAWEAMGNAERLDWMLAVSDTTFMLTADRVAILKRRKD